ncbi:amidase [Fulvivirgaceae bacterium BMA12]|uniref:Amidase n=1 Tax=Agaribacillus aureus TaxID=3051825 RepID=A0ABT8LHX2_9BACT|nr:amidase [Fulvivirgaceae bacterium BMA12]
MTVRSVLWLWLLIPNLIYAQSVKQDSLDIASKVVGLNFTLPERDSLREGVQENLGSYVKIRKYPIDNSIPPALGFNPVLPGMTFEKRQEAITWPYNDKLSRPKSDFEIALMPVSALASLIKNKKITATELTKIYLNRLKKYGDTLKCVVTITEELALRQARRADEEIAAGHYRGPLHGIPYGVKDLLAVEGYKTTWGAMPFKDQVIDKTATVVSRLGESGAILVAKLTMGALAWGDVWFGGTTKNPWNLQQGSSGSSAGSASATAAGLVGFSIGTETWGSIVSPSTRCGVTGLRPTYGRVSRYGAMALSWSMDKIGPICRSAQDCAMVFNAMYGPDQLDATLVDLPFNYKGGIALKNLKIGYFKTLFDRNYINKKNDSLTLEVLKSLGAKLTPVKLPEDVPAEALAFILSAEAAAAFDDLTRSNRDSLLVRQIKNAWPNVFRTARYIPAVEYIQANRLRYLLQVDFHEMIKDFDVIISPSFGGMQLLTTNLTGHPCVVTPNGFNQNGGPTSISFIGNLYDEATILAVARQYQNATAFDEKHPLLFTE